MLPLKWNLLKLVKMSKICDIPVISLDLETGGLIPGKHTPLAIGAVVFPGGDLPAVPEMVSYYVQLEWDTVVVDPIALRINKLDIVNPPGERDTFNNTSKPAVDAICEFHSWLSKHVGVDGIYAMGLNVGSFDLPMLKSIWNIGMNRPWPFHYRSIDLNSLFFALSQIQNKPFDIVKQEITKIAWGNNERFTGMEHHALADAWFNIHVWRECLKRLNGDCEVLC